MEKVVMESEKIYSLLEKMTIEEKIGQLVQLTPDYFLDKGEMTGPMAFWPYEKEDLFQIGSILGTHTASQVIAIQKEYLEGNRLKIPLMFMADVIHGYETIFPIPLAIASTFDPKVAEEVASLSALEATESGIQVTFSPMVDHVKDARWGRVMESNGEDPVLSSALARAYVRGYQAGDLTKNQSKMAACLKHFIGYGASEGGRDYNHVDLSDIELYQNYIPAFSAAIDEGASLVMTSFNAIKGIPSTGNEQIIKQLLRDTLGFKGVVISDWSAIAELIAHRVAGDKKEAARMAFDASVDIDMVSDCYQYFLAQQLSEQDKKKLNESVLRILSLKNKLGLFEDPYRGLLDTTENTKKKTASKEIRSRAREIAAKTIVLLKNQDNILPLKKHDQVALVGPKATSTDLLGAWSYKGNQDEAVTICQGLSEKMIDLSVVGSETNAIDSQEKLEMIEAAKYSEKVVIAVGETKHEIGENKSKASLRLNKDQIDLIQSVYEVNPNIILVLINGRPLVLTDVEPYVKAIVEGWFPGSEGGHAIADILMGDAQPSAKLPMSFPKHEGQIPLTYQQYSTGRPSTVENEAAPYVTKYIDVTNTPLYSFGTGLSYSSFDLTSCQQSAGSLSEKQELILSASVSNSGNCKASVIVQLYIEDCVTKVVRPMRELKQWRIMTLESGEEQLVEFIISEKDLQYTHADLSQTVDEGVFNYWIEIDAHTPKQGQFKFISSKK